MAFYNRCKHQPQRINWEDKNQWVNDKNPLIGKFAIQEKITQCKYDKINNVYSNFHL